MYSYVGNITLCIVWSVGECITVGIRSCELDPSSILHSFASDQISIQFHSFPLPVCACAPLYECYTANQNDHSNVFKQLRALKMNHGRVVKLFFDWDGINNAIGCTVLDFGSSIFDLLSYVTNSTWNQVTDKYTCYVILIGIKYTLFQ